MDKKLIISLIVIGIITIFVGCIKNETQQPTPTQTPTLTPESTEDVFYWIGALKSEDPKIHFKAVDELRNLKDERAVEPLIQALKDEDRNVRCGAVIVLGEIGDVRAVEPLIQALKDEDSVVRSLAAEALGKIGDERAVGPLREAGLNDEYFGVQYSAQKAFAKFNIDPESSVLIVKLKSKYTYLDTYYSKADELPDRQTHAGDTLYHTLMGIRLPKYNRSSFTCGHAAAYLEWYLEGAGFNASIACGDIKNESHAWVIVELPEGRIAIEGTDFCEISEDIYGPFLPRIAFKNPEDKEDQVYYNPDRRYDDIYGLIYEECGYVWDEQVVEDVIEGFDWWNVDHFVPK
jgi:hypothetical protein